MGDRFAYLGGLPTAEVYAAAYKALGMPVYSSAVFNFIPKTAMDFYHAVAADDLPTSTACSTTSSCPTSRSATAAGLCREHRQGRRDDRRPRAGPVRAPLTDLKPDEVETLKALIDKLGPQ